MRLCEAVQVSPTEQHRASSPFHQRGYRFHSTAC
jgi:hypothetical protein